MRLLLLLILVYTVGFTGQFLRKFFFLAFPVREEIGPICRNAKIVVMLGQQIWEYKATLTSFHA